MAASSAPRAYAGKRGTATSFPLTPCHFFKFNQYYYAIGNSPPMNILMSSDSRAFNTVKQIELGSWRTGHHFDPSFETALTKLRKDATQMNILCLACGDLRNILFSLAGLGDVGNVSTKFHFVVNDYDIHILARNILLLDAMLDEKNNEEMNASIFSIWFSTGLSSEQYDFLLTRLQKLIRNVEYRQNNYHNQQVEGPEKIPSRWKWNCWDPQMLKSLCETWKKWSSFFRGSSIKKSTVDNVAKEWQRTQRMRHKTAVERRRVRDDRPFPTTFESLKAAHSSLIKEEQVGSNLRVWALKLSVESSSKSTEKKQLKDELSEHLLTGLFNPVPQKVDHCWHVNPTLFWSEDAYNLHYGTDSSLAFPFFPLSPRKNLVRMCFEEFKAWVRAARKFRLHVEWMFSDADAREFCESFLHKQFRLDRPEAPPFFRSTDVIERESASTTLSPGALIYTHGLKSTHLNSCYGIVMKKANSERWGVQLVARDKSQPLEDQLPAKPLAIKASNLKTVKQNCDLLCKQKALACFDVITTSNVADHLGLSTLLILSRPLLETGGVLLTTTFLQKDVHSQGTGEFLKASLLDLDRHYWSTVFHFRAMGYEGNAVATPACQIGHNEASNMSFLIGGGTRSNTTIVWIATGNHSNVPLALDGRIMQRLRQFNSLTTETNGLQIMDGQVATLMNRLCTNEEIEGMQTDKSHRIPVKQTERDLLTRILLDPTATRENDIGLFSIEIPTETFLAVFHSQRITPVMYVLLGNKRFWGLWFQQQEEIREAIRLYFFCWRSCIRERSNRADLCSDIPSLGLTRFLRDAKVCEEFLDDEKLCNIAAILAERTELYDDQNDKNLSVPSPVTFRLYDETDSTVVIQIKKKQSSSPLFLGTLTLGPLSDISITVSQDSAGTNHDHHDITVDLRVRCTQLGKNPCSQDIAVCQKLTFSDPVTAYGWSYNSTKGLLTISKKPYSFFSTIRRRCGYNQFGTLKNGTRPPSGWKMDGLELAFMMQFSADEQELRKARQDNREMKLPLLTEVKESLMSLAHTKDLVTNLMMKEPGVGIVGIVLFHQILFDRVTFVPVLDLSVCWLTHHSVPEIPNALAHLSPQYYRHLKMSCEEYALFQNLCNYFRASMDPTLLVEHPDLRTLIPERHIRACFRRVLLPPLFPSAAEQEEFMKTVGLFKD